MSDNESVVNGGPPPRMPPRAKSAYHPRRARLSTAGVDGAPAAADAQPPPPPGARLPVRRRASFATVPDAKPPIRRGMSVVPRRRGSGAATFVGVRQNRHSVGGADPELRTAEERAFADEVRAARAKAAADKEEPAVCGMCGNCREGGMPDWAPERLAKMTPDERRMVLMNVRAKEEAGKIASEIRRRNLENGIVGVQPNNANPADGAPGNHPQRPPVRRQSSRLSAVLAPGNNSDARRRPKFVAKPSPERTHHPRPHEDVPPPVSVERNKAVDDEVQEVALPKPKVPETEMDIFGASDSDTAVDCADCDHLEIRVKDLEEQLGVLREVVKVSGGDPAVSSASDSLDIDSSMVGKGKKKVAWHERVLGTFVGAPPGSETARLKDEVGALRKATNVLFEKLQSADAKRAPK